MPRELTSAEIETLASGTNVKRVAVENFLGSIDVTMAKWEHECNLRTDAISYRWNTPTTNAIKKGLAIAYGK